MAEGRHRLPDHPGRHARNGEDDTLRARGALVGAGAVRDRELEEVRRRFPETFRKAIAFYVGGAVDMSGCTTNGEMTERALRAADLALLGVTKSASYRLVKTNGAERRRR